MSMERDLLHPLQRLFCTDRVLFRQKPESSHGASAGNPAAKTEKPEHAAAVSLFFRDSASDRLLPTEAPFAAVSLRFDIDLGETKPVYAELLRRLLEKHVSGRGMAAATRTKLTDRVNVDLNYYTGFAVLSLSCYTFHANTADCVSMLGNSAVAIKEGLNEEAVAPLLEDYAINRLYRTEDTSRYAYDVGLHNFILYTDDILLPQNINNENATEALMTAADLIMVPDNAVYTIYYDEQRGANPQAIRKRLAAARIRLFV